MNRRRAPLKVARLRRSTVFRDVVGLHIDVVKEIESTNDRCHQVAEADRDDAGGYVVFAESQTAGRGRHGSAWSAPPRSSLLFSLLLRPPEALDTPSFLTAWSAVSIVDVFLDRYGFDASIKWPNDILVDEKKLCGILVERRQATVVGIGLNVSTTPDEFPADPRIPVTSLELLVKSGREINRTQLAVAILDRLDERWRQVLTYGTEPLYRDWQNVSRFQPGDVVRAETLGEPVTGTLLRLRPDFGAQIDAGLPHPIEIPPERLVRLERPSDSR